MLSEGGDSEDDCLVARGADDTRPVSLANSDSKICELALNRPLAGAIGKWAVAEQRGFLADRMLVDNVIELDTYGRVCSITADRYQGPAQGPESRIPKSLPALAFFDFAAAFPSVAWKYLWLCMRFCGLPKPYIRAFKKVYRNNLHFLRFMGKVYEAYVNASGVKTGGTASGTIFVLCIDPFLHMLQMQRGPRDIGRTFADDIGYVIFDLHLTLPRFAECFRMFGKISNVKLKIKKTIIVPLWTTDVEEAERVISKIAPEWSGVKISLHAKYLGIHLGPRSANFIWTGALDKYVARVQAARTTGAGLLTSVIEYNTMCITTLNYIGQYCITDAPVLATEARMLQRLTGCPRYTFSKEALWSLDALGMGQNFKSIKVCNMAAMTRMALQTTTVFSEMKAMLDEALNSDSAMLLSLATSEISNFDTPAIVNSMQKAIDHAFLPDMHHWSWRAFLVQLDRNELNGGMQKELTNYLGKVTLDFKAAEFLSRRMARWRSAVSIEGEEWWDFCGPFALQLSNVDLKGAPDHVIAAYLKTLLNGWASARRLAQKQVRCVFKCGSHQDCIEHYLVCNVIQEVWQRIFSVEWGPFECRLAIGSAEWRGRVVRAYFLYGIFAAYNHFRHNGFEGRLVEVCTNLVRSKITYALGKSTTKIRQCFSEPSVTPARLVRQPAVTLVRDVIFNFRKRARNDYECSKSRKRQRSSGPKRSKGA